jgi:hypothetical protein
LGDGVIDASAQLLGATAINAVWGNLPPGLVPASIACKLLKSPSAGERVLREFTAVSIFRAVQIAVAGSRITAWVNGASENLSRVVQSDSRGKVENG